MQWPVVASNPQASQPSVKERFIGHVTGTFKPAGAMFTMTDFEEHRRANDRWYSPPFYTRPNGYKMCLRADANGYGPGRGTHLSVYAALVQGEFDDQLKWPFRGYITVKLLNQEEDREDVAHTVCFDKSTPEECCKRVTPEHRWDGRVWGSPLFLPHAKLQPKFLKNDCIKLCIKKVEMF